MNRHTPTRLAASIAALGLLGLGACDAARAQHAHAAHAAHAEHAEHAEHADAQPTDADEGHAQHVHGPASPPEHAASDAHRHHEPAADHAPLPREPIPVVTEADRAAAFPQLDHATMTHAASLHSFLLVDRLEAWDAPAGTGQAWEATAWIGGDVHRLWLRSEGERAHGRTGTARWEALYGRSVSPWWDVLAGVGHDTRPARARSWAVLGVQGLAPYRFEIGASAYLADSGQVQLKAEAEYEVLLTQRLILQPALEATASLKAEPEYALASGLNSLEAGLRLRYEINRRFAPYLGLVHERRFGDTARLVRDTGEHVRDTRIVAGLRLWF